MPIEGQEVKDNYYTQNSSNNNNNKLRTVHTVLDPNSWCMDVGKLELYVVESAGVPYSLRHLKGCSKLSENL